MQEKQSGKEQKPEEAAKENKTASSFVSPPVDNKLDSLVKESKENKSNPEGAQDKSEVASPPITETNKTNKWKRTEIISLCGVLLSTIAVVISSISVNQTIRSVKLTEASFKRNLEKDSIASLSQRKRDSIDNIHAKISFDKDTTQLGIAKRSLQAQILSVQETQKQVDQSRKRDENAYSIAQKSLALQDSSIKETQRQFEISNSPFLEIREFILKDFEPNKKPYIIYTIANQGRMPAKIIGFRYHTWFKPAPVIDKVSLLKDLYAAYNGLNGYVAYQQPQTGRFNLFTDNSTLPQKMYDESIGKSTFIYFGGQVDYLNVADKSHHNMKFVFYIDPTRSGSYSSEFLENY